MNQEEPTSEQKLKPTNTATSDRPKPSENPNESEEVKLPSNPNPENPPESNKDLELNDLQEEL